MKRDRSGTQAHNERSSERKRCREQRERYKWVKCLNETYYTVWLLLLFAFCRFRCENNNCSDCGQNSAAAKGTEKTERRQAQRERERQRKIRYLYTLYAIRVRSMCALNAWRRWIGFFSPRSLIEHIQGKNAVKVASAAVATAAATTSAVAIATEGTDTCTMHGMSCLKPAQMYIYTDGYAQLTAHSHCIYIRMITLYTFSMYTTLYLYLIDDNGWVQKYHLFVWVSALGRLRMGKASKHDDKNKNNIQSNMIYYHYITVNRNIIHYSFFRRIFDANILHLTQFGTSMPCMDP